MTDVASDVYNLVQKKLFNQNLSVLSCQTFQTSTWNYTRWHAADLDDNSVELEIMTVHQEGNKNSKRQSAKSARELALWSLLHYWLQISNSDKILLLKVRFEFQ